MVLEVEINQESVKKLEKFLTTSKYKELAESAMSFNRKLNEERKMRIPYVDGQTGVAQRHYDMMRKRHERMPGRREGQIVSYPQRKWMKKRYQYLHNLMAPKHLRYEQPIAEPSLAGEHPAFLAEDTNNVINQKDNWEYFDDETYAMQEPIGSEPESDSDFEYEGGRVKRGKARKSSNKNKLGLSRSAKKKNAPEPDDRPTTQDRSSRSARRSVGAPTPQPTPPPAPPAPRETTPSLDDQFEPLPVVVNPKPKAESSGYCDFCLGDSVMNKKTGSPEELIACAICGRAGHPSCLQFTKNMMVSVRKYPWQCIECKSCTLCGTSENDDKLLFCDDCDRGYHMYCLVPPMKVAPEGSWSCSICVETFHRK